MSKVAFLAASRHRGAASTARALPISLQAVAFLCLGQAFCDGDVKAARYDVSQGDKNTFAIR